MDLVGELRVFLAVAEDEHVTRAADRLGLAQPVVSRRLRALERELGVELFARTGRRVTITEPGRRLVPLARELIEQADRILELRATAGAVDAPRVRLALPAGGEVAQLAGLIRLGTDHGLALSLTEGTEPERRRRLADGEVDLSLLRVGPDDAEFRVPLGFGSAADLADLPPAGGPDGVRPLHLDALRGRTGRRPGPSVLVQPEDAHPGFLDELVRAAARAGLTADQLQPLATLAPARVLAGEGLLLCSHPEASRVGLRWRPSGDRFERCYALTGAMTARSALPDGFARGLRRAFGGRVRAEVRPTSMSSRPLPTALFG